MSSSAPLEPDAVTDPDPAAPCRTAEAHRASREVSGAGEARAAPTLVGLVSPARRIAWAAAEAILAERGADGAPTVPDPARCRHVVDSFSATMASVSGTMRFGMHGLLALLELLPVVVVRRVARMSKLPLAERIAYLQALEEGRHGLLATLLVGVKVPMSIYAFEEGEPLARTGYDRSSLAATEQRDGPRAEPSRRSPALGGREVER